MVRFSALGDVLLTLGAVRHLQKNLPYAEITWITSPQSMLLLSGITDIHFEIIDKPRSFADYRQFYQRFRHQKFDIVLAMQANLRINLLYPALHAPTKIGFDKTRAREGQLLFTNRRIPSVESQPSNQRHLLDSFLAFTEVLGIPKAETIDCSLALSDTYQQWASEQLTHLPQPILAIHPCASKAERNWPESRLAEIVSAAAEMGYGLVLTGGNAPDEMALCARLAASASSSTLNLCGRTTPKQLAALFSQARAVLAPDTFAVHLARAVNTRVIGLYAVASSQLSGPYQRTDYCVDRHAEAIETLLGLDPATVPWNTRVHHPKAMALITVADVLAKIKLAMEAD